MKMETRVKLIRKWLERGDYSPCPFIPHDTYVEFVYVSDTLQKEHCTFCNELFKYTDSWHCPCSKFGRKVVIKKAQRFVNSWNKINTKGDK